MKKTTARKTKTKVANPARTERLRREALAEIKARTAILDKRSAKVAAEKPARKPRIGEAAKKAAAENAAGFVVRSATTAPGSLSDGLVSVAAAIPGPTTPFAKVETVRAVAGNAGRPAELPPRAELPERPEIDGVVLRIIPTDLALSEFDRAGLAIVPLDGEVTPRVVQSRAVVVETFEKLVDLVRWFADGFHSTWATVRRLPVVASDLATSSGFLVLDTAGRPEPRLGLDRDERPNSPYRFVVVYRDFPERPASEPAPKVERPPALTAESAAQWAAAFADQGHTRGLVSPLLAKLRLAGVIDERGEIIEHRIKPKTNGRGVRAGEIAGISATAAVRWLGASNRPVEAAKALAAKLGLAESVARRHWGLGATARPGEKVGRFSIPNPTNDQTNAILDAALGPRPTEVK